MNEISNLLPPDVKCNAFFGMGSGMRGGSVEIRKQVLHPISLYDVRVIWVKWVLLRWEKRCEKYLSSSPRELEPTVWFTPRLDQTVSNDIDWCQRSGGVPFKRIELFVLKKAFRFKRVRKHA
jgi:hypothetical protein